MHSDILAWLDIAQLLNEHWLRFGAIVLWIKNLVVFLISLGWNTDHWRIQGSLLVSQWSFSRLWYLNLTSCACRDFVFLTEKIFVTWCLTFPQSLFVALGDHHKSIDFWSIFWYYLKEKWYNLLFNSNNINSYSLVLWSPHIFLLQTVTCVSLCKVQCKLKKVIWGPAVTSDTWLLI